MRETGLGSPCYHPDACVWACLLHGPIVYDNAWIVENVVGYLCKNGGLNKHLCDMTPLQLGYVEIQLCHGSSERVQRHHFLAMNTKNDDQLWSKSSITEEYLPPCWETFITTMCTCICFSRKVLQNHELYYVWTRLEENICLEFGQWSLHCIEYGWQITTSWDKFFVRAE
jgi:hypothetical protein